MSDLAMEIVGYTAAVINNISVYPQAYEVYIIVSAKQYEKLKTLSTHMFMLQLIGCALWLLYSYYKKLYPIIFGSIMTILPSGYILLNICYYNDARSINENSEGFQSEIIIATSSVFSGDTSPIAIEN